MSPDDILTAQQIAQLISQLAARHGLDGQVLASIMQAGMTRREIGEALDQLARTRGAR